MGLVWAVGGNRTPGARKWDLSGNLVGFKWEFGGLQVGAWWDLSRILVRLDR